LYIQSKGKQKAGTGGARIEPQQLGGGLISKTQRRRREHSRKGWLLDGHMGGTKKKQEKTVQKKTCEECKSKNGGGVSPFLGNGVQFLKKEECWRTIWGDSGKPVGKEIKCRGESSFEEPRVKSGMSSKERGSQKSSNLMLVKERSFRKGRTSSGLRARKGQRRRGTKNFYRRTKSKKPRKTTLGRRGSREKKQGKKVGVRKKKNETERKPHWKRKECHRVL